jgi:hypothetical protein
MELMVYVSLGYKPNFGLGPIENSPPGIQARIFAAWKDADLDVPILKQAKVEYAKMN